MLSDSDYDGFDYFSSQDAFDIEQQIDRFELRRSVKTGKVKRKRSSCPVSVKTVRSHLAVMKVHCTSEQPTPKAARKPYRYDRYPPIKRDFQCDEEFPIEGKPASTSSETDEDEHLQDFSTFRRRFYQKKHQAIKSSLACVSNLTITDIRPAAINESVQNDFMKRLKQKSSCSPQLVYHGTSLSNIDGILRYGLLVPKQAHPSNPDAPIISSKHGQALGKGIYCTRIANISLGYLTSTNTLLACAAIPQRDRSGRVTRYHGNILVLPHVSQIIPLFLLDFEYSMSSRNHPHFGKPKQVEKQVEERKPITISRKYLRKTLRFINDQERRSDQYQSRLFDLS